MGYGFEAKLLQNSTTREEEVRDLTGQSRGASGRKTKPGVEMPTTTYRDGEAIDLRIKSSERGRFLKGPSLH